MSDAEFESMLHGFRYIDHDNHIFEEGAWYVDTQNRLYVCSSRLLPLSTLAFVSMPTLMTSGLRRYLQCVHTTPIVHLRTLGLGYNGFTLLEIFTTS